MYTNTNEKQHLIVTLLYWDSITMRSYYFGAQINVSQYRQVYSETLDETGVNPICRDIIHTDFIK